MRDAGSVLLHHREQQGEPSVVGEGHDHRSGPYMTKPPLPPSSAPRPEGGAEASCAAGSVPRRLRARNLLGREGDITPVGDRFRGAPTKLAELLLPRTPPQVRGPLGPRGLGEWLAASITAVRDS